MEQVTKNMERENQQMSGKGKLSSLLLFIGGLVIGVLLSAITGWVMMPKLMLTTHQSRYDSVEETCKQLKIAIKNGGWQCPAVRNMNKAMLKHGVTFAEPVRIVELCNAQYAKAVLATNPEVSTLMPCAWGVYKGKDGKVYITGMNMGLMGKMFGGNIAKVMGGAVAAEEQQMLKSVIRE
ncbi:MAG: DUF302 domain-containing protein [Victivallaceae bacterium]|nr:DUF302 domain-containing protein [Victivallaceae bacterium]